jgi:hypothetical protein
MTSIENKNRNPNRLLLSVDAWIEKPVIFKQGQAESL